MRALIWSFRLLVFLVFFAFAAKNTDPVTLRFFFGVTWQLPLVALLLLFFASGAGVGILAMTVPYLRQWRAKRRLRAEVAQQSDTNIAVQPPSAGA